MSQYLTTSDTDYVPSGVTLTTPLIIRASAIIDAKCKRSLDVQSYTERVPLTDFQYPTRYQRGHLSYSPVISIDALKGRPLINAITGNIFGPPQFETITDTSILDVDMNLGTFICGFNMFGIPYTELEVTYQSGYGTIPDTVKVACGMIVSQLASGFDGNAKSKKDFDFSIEYFSASILTPDIEALLGPYIHRTIR